MTERMAEDTTSTTTTQTKMTARSSKPWTWLLAGLLLGALLILGIRFATYQPHAETHYHANFAVYINGVREEFKDPQYYQEVKICDLHGTSPQARTHMHDEENGVIHVHDDAVTWGQFFENVGWIVGPDFIRSTTTLYQADGTNKLNILLNGQDLTDLTTITNEVIDNKDRLLLSYGPVDQAVLQQQYKTVASDAGDYNNRQDPASCGGHEASGISDRLRNLF
ncbi:MAG TPA: hypothetical protein VF575_01000 [Candidatus Saccharimonadales bacterium]|jgi:hypothetical protein